MRSEPGIDIKWEAMTTKHAILATILLSAPGLMPAANQYLQHNLVADTATAGADHVDANLVNPWGICASSGSPLWISDNGTGLSTLYTSNGTPNATTKPVVPATGASAAAPGSPTGCVYNGTATAFFVPNTTTGKTANFLFATENGSLSGWSSGVNPAQAIVMVDNSATGAVYKGLAIATPTGGTPQLYATNFNAGKVEIYDQTWKPVTLTNAFADPAIPAGYAPFNIQTLAGKLYVTYAKQDAAKRDDVAGAGNGYVDVYDLSGNLLTHLISAGNLNAPWGVALAPAGFGDYAGDLLVANFGDGAINVYNPTTGAFIATLQDTTGKMIHISGLWALQNGNGGSGGDANAVYFTAGTGGEQHGLLGSLQAAPSIPTGAVANAASNATSVAPGGFVSIYGTNLAATTRTWTTADFVSGKLPTTIDGISATVDGKPAYIYYVSPLQIDLIAPADTTQGPVNVVVTNNGLVSATASVTLATYAPGFFIIPKSNYIAALHPNNTVVGPATLFPNISTPAKSGEIISLYATGMGPVSPVEDGLVVLTSANTTTTPTVTINGVAATVSFSGMTMSGLYQVNVAVPANTPNGDQTVILTIGGAKTQATALINVSN
jgi:uncharacterized protein (TIGR03118 family)